MGPFFLFQVSLLAWSLTQFPGIYSIGDLRQFQAIFSDFRRPELDLQHVWFLVMCGPRCAKCLLNLQYLGP